jgi:hypothetical protein
MGHEKPVEPFSDLHFEEGHVTATLLHDPTVEGLDMALYMDGSASMKEEYEYRAKSNRFLDWIFGRKPDPATNLVEPQVRWMLEYLATKDRNGLLRVAYWACGEGGKRIEVLGELKGKDVAAYVFPGPKDMGTGTRLAPAMRNYLEYLKAQAKVGAKRGCAVFITDGQIHDEEEVHEVSKSVAAEIVSGRLPRTNFVLVGVGGDVNEKQLEEIAHQEFKGVGHLWCHRIAEEIGQVAELVAVLVDENMTVAAGGTITDDKGTVIKIYEGRLPAVLEFDVPEGTESFTLEVNGQKFTQPLPEDDDHHDGDDDDH